MFWEEYVCWDKISAAGLICRYGMEVKMSKVVKFGGSSLASAEQFEKAGDIIRADESRRFVVQLPESVLAMTPR